MNAKPIFKLAAVCTLAMTLSSGMAFAQDHHDNDQHDNHHYVRHDEWRKGEHIKHEDWDRGDRVDYRHNHLQAPPRGYEWREVDGNYVLAAPDTGEIVRVVPESRRH